MSLFEIDRLIRRTEYDEALRQLNNYLKINPDNFDNAQTRIRRIMVARRQYSILAERLIDLIEKDPGNNKEIYEITAQLEKFERHPSDQNLQFIADLKKSAEFNYFRAQFMEIQNATAENTNKKEYVAAIEKAKEGFWLYRDDFDLKWEDQPEVIASVDAIVNDLHNQINALEERRYLPAIQDAVTNFIRAVNSENYDQALQRFNAVQTFMADYNRLRQNIINDGEKMQQKFEELRALDADSSDASYLPFMFRFIFGSDAVANSGILGAIDAQWNDYTKQMNDAVFDVLTKNYSKYTAKNFVPNSKYSQDINSWASLEQNVLDLYKIPSQNKAHKLFNPLEEYYVLTDYVNTLGKESVRLANVWSRVQTTEKNQGGILNQIKNKDASANARRLAVTQLFNSNTELGNLVGIRNSQELENMEWTEAYRLSGRQDWDGLSELYENTLAQIFDKSSELLTGAWTEITEYYKQSADNIYADTASYNQSAEKYNNGFFTKIPDNLLAEINSDIKKAKTYEDTFNADPEMDFGINYSYPDISKALSAYVQKQVDSDIGTINSFESDINTGFSAHTEWKNESGVVTLVNEANEYLENQKKQLAALKGLAVTNEKLAQAKIISAELTKNEAEIRYSEAKNALRSNDFTTARKKLQDAVSKYDESLTYKNDEKLRIQVDDLLQTLGDQIVTAENELVVREVRQLKNEAKDAYFNGRFDDAEKLLNQAKTRWAVTNIVEDEEITNLLNFVNTAISMKTGRDILPSAPQYPEMSQLLNLAYQYFDEGSRKIGEGNKTAGLANLDLALQNIQKLQYVYPLNQEAAILTLRINRLKDPQKFKEEFAQKIEMAKLMCQSKDTRQEGYANLLDYYELQPDYPGLKDLIYQVEIDIGIRQKPVDNSGVTRAHRLLTQAQTAFDKAGNDQTKLNNALSLVNQSLALVSDNQTAIKLKDQITTKIGGTTSTVLSTEDERLYQLAIQRLQNNNVVGANAIVEQLLKKKSNANSQKIKELKNKIDARS